MAPGPLLERQISGVLFDWGDTLVHPPGLTTDPESHFGCVETFFKEDLPTRLPEASAFTASAWQDFRANYEAVASAQIRETFETGREHSFEQRFQRTLAASFPNLNLPDDSDLDWMAARFGERITEECWLMTDADDVLPALGQRFKVGLLSNYPHAPAVHRSLDRFGLLAHLDTLTVSGDIGWAKPHANAFEQAIAQMQLPPEQLLYVGDDLVNDMQGAKAMGMSTAWLPRKGQSGEHACVDVRIDRLKDLIGLIPGDDGTLKQE